MHPLRSLIALGLLAAAAALPAAADARVGCGDGATAFRDGRLRIFGVHYRTSFERGFEEYACLGRRRPLPVGGVGSDNGVGSNETSVYAHAGRYLASYSQSDSEGGPDAHVTVVDLIRRKTVSFINLACCEWRPSLRLARDGTVIVLSPGEGLFVKAPGRRPRTLAPEGAASDLAMYGGTVYWTEGGRARSSTLPGVGGRGATALEPVRLHRRGGGCAAARGRTIAASGSVRVYETPDGRRACRIGHRSFALAGSSPPRIVGDRWLLVFGEGTARVIDTTTGRTGATARDVTDAVLQADGGLAWLDPEGRVISDYRGFGPHWIGGPGASQLAAARRAVYWTEGGVPHVWRVARPLPD